ncbi:ArnT family glycosyltransferase [Tundrisphaera lichenicola]|uniref:ArnT family glycosyltransferase n=1 Tax=Tundrisphaera lichenicola TaxID=2029860 RepID=UPI003EB6E835
MDRRGLRLPMTWLLVPAGLGSMVLFLTGLFRNSTCETYDEYTYIRMGVCIYQRNDFASLASPMCPPLPILLEYGLPTIKREPIAESDEWEAAMPDLIRQARLMTSTLIGVPTVLLCFGWLTRRKGWVVGLLGGALVGLSPSVLAAASIATTDACFVLFALVALAVLNRYQARPSKGSFLAVGAAIGAALASKQSAVFLFPIALMELLIKTPRQRPPGKTKTDFALATLLRIGSGMAALVGLAFLVDWAFYGFHLAPFGSSGTQTTVPVILPMIANLLPNGEAIMEVVNRSGMPLAIDTFVGQMNHASEGHSAFLMGRHSFHGWWYFFPVTIAIKSTPAELLMFALASFLATRRSTWRDPTRRLWLGSIAIMLAAGIASKLNIGHRYMLLIYPLAILLAVDWIGELASRRRVRAIALGVALLAWQAISLAGIAPHYLSYFNSLCGGPREGYRYLVDSSLDWGQDLPTLRRELEARQYRKVALCYFGTARPGAYGLRSADWMTSNDEIAAECDWLAISATSMQGAYGPIPELIQTFGHFPSDRAGYTFFLYDLKDPRIRDAWEARRTGRPIPDEEEPTSGRS